MSEPKDHPLTVLFTDTEYRQIERTASQLGVSKGAAVRLLVRRGATAPGHSPFTPQENQ